MSCYVSHIAEQGDGDNIWKMILIRIPTLEDDIRIPTLTIYIF